jgi:uncharacterized repeat protein (TIGR03803 family)
MERIVNFAKRATAIAALCATIALTSAAQTFTLLSTFEESTDGGHPLAALIQATDGHFYGTASAGGTQGGGTVFKVNTSGKLTPIYNFCTLASCADGKSPEGALVQAPNGDFYGTTTAGGANNAGTVFRLTSTGVLKTLYSFCPGGTSLGCPDGLKPEAGLVRATSGDFYGTTAEGGAHGGGEVFEISPTGGTPTVIYSFCTVSGCTDGQKPVAPLIQAANGDLYGTTESGGSKGYGTIFSIHAGTLTTMHNFNKSQGSHPEAALVEGGNGDLYGTTLGGGSLNDGTIFQITSGGTLTMLYSFCGTIPIGCPNGEFPQSALVLGTDGNLYGTANGEGGPTSSASGTLFQITTGGALTLLYVFCETSPCTDGSVPQGGLMQATNGTFYGTTLGAIDNAGTVFSLSLGLGPFVEPQTTTGKAGASVNILGNDLKGATSVTFNGTPAEFSVASESLITATVPAGATTGTIEVVTSSSTLSSNVPFRVLQ